MANTGRCLPNVPIDSTTALELAKNAELTFVCILGWTKDGHLYVGGNDVSEEELIYIFRKAEHAVLAEE